MQQEGRVIKLNEDSVKVMVIRKSACAHDCRSCAGGCAQEKPIYVDAEKKVDCIEGDFVVLQTPDAEILKGAFLVYMLPVIAFIAGLILGYLYDFKTYICVIFGTLMFGVSCFVNYLYEKKIRKRKKLPEIIKIL